MSHNNSNFVQRFGNWDLESHQRKQYNDRSHPYQWSLLIWNWSLYSTIWFLFIIGFMKSFMKIKFEHFLWVFLQWHSAFRDGPKILTILIQNWDLIIVLSQNLIRGVPYYKTESLWKSLITCIDMHKNLKIKH